MRSSCFLKPSKQNFKYQLNDFNFALGVRVVYLHMCAKFYVSAVTSCWKVPNGGFSSVVPQTFHENFIESILRILSFKFVVFHPSCPKSTHFSFGGLAPKVATSPFSNNFKKDASLKKNYFISESRNLILTLVAQLHGLRMYKPSQKHRLLGQIRLIFYRKRKLVPCNKGIENTYDDKENNFNCNCQTLPCLHDKGFWNSTVKISWTIVWFPEI